MCGIAGIVAYADAAPPVDRSELIRIREAMAARGPDGAGVWMADDQAVGLAHRRLAIIDLSETGAQPMSTPDGRFVVTFNGEIYNYREIRDELERKGVRLRSQSDTEVLLHLYAERGADMVHALRGMYAFALWDASNKTLFLARDPFGIKPLYYSDGGGVFRFASQVRALLQGDAIDKTPEAAGHVGFYLWGAVPEPYTLYRGIRALPAGTYMSVSRSGIAGPTRFFDIAAELAIAHEIAKAGVETTRESLAQAVRDSVRRHLVADVPVGLFLSSGLDSAVIAGVAAGESGGRLNALTLGFREYQGAEHDEVPLARVVAAHYSISHRTRWIERAEFERDLEKILAAMDQPSTDGVNTYFVSKAASEGGMKVALSGLGGDELFAGYPSFRHVPRLARWLRFARAVPSLGRAFRVLSAPLLRRITSPKAAGLLEYGGSYPGAYLLRRSLFMPWELEELLDPAMVKSGLEELQPLLSLDKTARGLSTPRQRVAALELGWYLRNQLLRDADWAGMAHSVEIRVPFLDVDLFRKVAPTLALPQPPAKRDVASALLRPPPQRVVQRPKTGFATPVKAWTSGGADSARGLRGWACRVLPPVRRFRALALVTDAYGRKGGIAKFNRDLLGALCAMDDCAEVVAVPRLISAPLEPLPAKLVFLTDGAAGKFAYVWTVLQTAFGRRFDLVIAGHVNLLPLASIAAWLAGGRLLLVIHGIDAWSRHSSALVRRSLPRVSAIAAVSHVTLERFASWSDIDPQKCYVVPNCVELERYGPGPKSSALAERLGVCGRPVIMTTGRLSSRERYKGFDTILDAMPELMTRVPGLVYLIVGEGNDRKRLEAKTAALGLKCNVVFTGFIPEEEKADYFRLADAYVMPSRGEGFGIVFLEAMACGTPVLGSKVDGSREALLSGDLGVLVDPGERRQVIEGVLEALRRSRVVPEKLQFFSKQNFELRIAGLVRQVIHERT